MDNDDYRRGRLTNHKVFGEALAVLAGDGLLTAAFETAASAATDPAVTVKAIRILAEQAGELGMVGGQVLDMDAEEQELTEQGIYDIQCRKTGALIQAACQIGVDVYKRQPQRRSCRAQSSCGRRRGRSGSWPCWQWRSCRF